MDFAALFAQRTLTGTERYQLLPVFVLMGVAIIGWGVNALRLIRKERRARLSLSDRRSWLAGLTVCKGVLLCTGGTLVIVGSVAMMVLGKTLLTN